MIGFTISSAVLAYGAETNADEPQAVPPPRPPGSVALSFDSADGHMFVLRDHADLVGRAKSATSTLEAKIEGTLRALIEGPTEKEAARGAEAFFPPLTLLADLVITSDSQALEIFFEFPPEFVNSPQYSERFVEELGHHVIDTLMELGVRSYTFKVKDPESGAFRPIRHLLPENRDKSEEQLKPPSLPAQDDVEKQTEEKNAPPDPNPGSVTGALSGKAVVLNQSHGWFDDDNFGRWRVQRTRCFEQVEDYASGEFINHFVIPLLLNAGARVQPVREPDAQTNMVLVDNAMGSPRYVETGTWANSTAVGFVDKAGASWTGLTFNPFGNASATRFANPAPLNSPTATASYIPTFPAAGYYNVYISYSASSNRTTNAHWQVHHTGGISDFRVNQKIDGATWVLLGNFYFNAGQNSTTGKVMVLNDTSDSGVVTCDAVRFGGGMGDVARRTHGVSGRPRWTEEACNYLAYLGGYKNEPTGIADGPLYGDSASSEDEALGWSNRPQYARWEQQRDAEGDNVVYLGWHTNASSFTCDSGGNEVSGTGRGTASYRDVDADATAGTETMTPLVHNSLIDGIRKFYSSSWQNRGIVGSNSYGECNQVSLGSVSGFFFEGLFHDNSADSGVYKDPKFRLIMARAIVQGIIQYYGGSTYPPEAPTNFRVRNIGGSQARLDWAAGPVRTGTLPYGSAATGYRIHRSTNGYGFDAGTDIGNVTNYITSLTPGQTYYFRVAARNSGGVSIPTETLAVRLPTTGATPILIVNGYDRYDRYLPRTISVTLIGGCSNAAPNTLREIHPRNIQSFNYSIQHATAIAAAGYAFDSSSNECIDAGQVSLGSYPIVDWIGGQEAEADTADNQDNTALSVNMRNAIQTYLQNGGKLFMSTSELAWDFGRSTAAADKKTFLSSYMKTNYAADSSNTYQAQGSAGIFAGIGTFGFDNGTGGTYNVRFPDVFTTTGGSTSCMSYVGGTGGIAAIQYSGVFGASSTPAKLVHMGFGFETITSQTTRNTVMAAILNFFGAGSIGAGIDEWAEF